ncbi:AraC family transcriptional regulator [Winogradskyella sp.]|uniref:helix-turn-helix domain-containing protein n=1 Tax=Winogradskyella sp. TaxID=1883156 RepID=UPI002623475F|nr:helix-turn-helix domain-containing protein [Winogradskyella sp.]
MKYLEHEISTPNNLIIKSVFWLECDKINRFQFFLPNGHPEFMVTDFPVSVISKSKLIIEHKTCLFWGQIRFSGHIISTHPYKMFGITFQPWVLRLITNPNNPQLLDSIVSGHLVFSPDIIKYTNNLLKTEKFHNSLNYIEEELSDLLINKILNQCIDQEDLIKTTLAIKNYPSLKISEHLTLYNKSLRTLENQFRKNIGITPKEYQKIVRLRKASEDIKNGKKFIDAALDSGYYDQPHFNNEFKKATAKSPTQFTWNENLILSKL